MIYYQINNRLAYCDYTAAAAASAIGATESKPRCSICGKGFASSKALHGHMRCHPERDWRGILPPPPKPINLGSYTSSSSPTLAVSNYTTAHNHDEPQQLLGNYCHSWPAISGIQTSLNASDWAVNPKRGRKPSIQACSDHALSHQDSNCYVSPDSILPIATASAGSEQLTRDEEDAIIGLLLLQVGSGLPSKKPRLADVDQFSQLLNKDIASFGILFPDDFNTISTKSLLLDQKMCTATTALSSGQEERGTIRTENDRQLKVIESNHRCNICNKSFNSYRALGGHKSSHFNKAKSPVVEESGFKRESRLTPRSDGKSHQCKVCNKSFESGQKLGGHMRRHWTTPAIAAKALPHALLSASISTAEKKEMLGFDLNELPDADEGESLPQPNRLHLFPC
ncbi:hypothetical protein Ancab_015547 [Ancistrocladus abbreviatus]